MDDTEQQYERFESSVESVGVDSVWWIRRSVSDIRARASGTDQSSHAGEKQTRFDTGTILRYIRMSEARVGDGRSEEWIVSLVPPHTEQRDSTVRHLLSELRSDDFTAV